MRNCGTQSLTIRILYQSGSEKIFDCEMHSPEAKFVIRGSDLSFPHQSTGEKSPCGMEWSPGICRTCPVLVDPCNQLVLFCAQRDKIKGLSAAALGKDAVF